MKKNIANYLEYHIGNIPKINLMTLPDLNEKVIRFDIPMNDVLGMQKLHSVDQMLVNEHQMALLDSLVSALVILKQFVQSTFAFLHGYEGFGAADSVAQDFHNVDTTL